MSQDVAPGRNRVERHAASILARFEPGDQSGRRQPGEESLEQRQVEPADELDVALGQVVERAVAQRDRAGRGDHRLVAAGPQLGRDRRACPRPPCSARQLDLALGGHRLTAVPRAALEGVIEALSPVPAAVDGIGEEPGDELVAPRRQRQLELPPGPAVHLRRAPGPRTAPFAGWLVGDLHQPVGGEPVEVVGSERAPDPGGVGGLLPADPPAVFGDVLVERPPGRLPEGGEDRQPLPRSRLLGRWLLRHFVLLSFPKLTDLDKFGWSRYRSRIGARPQDPMGDKLRQAKRPVSMLAGPYGHPLHPVLVTIPIGAWVASCGFDIASRVADEAHVFAKGAFWLIALGVLAALLAALVGFLDLFAIPTGTTAFRTGLLHMTLNLVVVTLFTVSWVVRRGDIDAPTETSGGLIALSAVALALLGGAGWLGGKLTFRYGVRVADEETQAEAYLDRQGGR